MGILEGVHVYATHPGGRGCRGGAVGGGAVRLAVERLALLVRPGAVRSPASTPHWPPLLDGPLLCEHAA